MNPVFRMLLLLSFLSFSAVAQSNSGAVRVEGEPTDSADARSLPPLVKYNGSLSADHAGRTFDVEFSIYSTRSSETPLWQESQSVAIDSQGRYTVLLGNGTAKGLPTQIFASGDARWLSTSIAGVQQGERTILVSVPYALKAGDADTFAGMPVSAFLLAPTVGPDGKTRRLANSTAQLFPTTAVDNGGTSGTINRVVKWTSATNVGDSSITDTGTKVGVGLASPTFTFDLANTDSTAAGADLMRIQTPSVNGARINFLSTSANGHNWAFGSNFIIGNGEFGIYDYTANKNRFLINAQGKIGFGVDVPTAQLDIANTDTTSAGSSLLRLRTPSVDGARINFISDSANGRNWAFGANFIIGNGEFGIYDNTANANRFLINAVGNIGIGTIFPTTALDVNGQVRAAGGVKFADNSIQTTAASLTGVTAGSGLAGGGTSGNVSLSLLTSCSSGQLLKWNGTAWACAADISTSSSGGGAVAFSAGNTTSVVSATQSGVGIANPSLTTFPPSAISGWATNATGFTVGVVGRTDSDVGAGVIGIATGAGNTNDRATALNGIATSTTGRTKGIEANVSSPDGTAASFHNDATSGNRTLIDASFGPDNGSTTMFHVDSTQINMGRTGANISLQGNTNINGNLSINGTLSKSSGSFKIDHPLDPENKFLYHSFVESPDMMNIYNGLVRLNAKGEAWVTMPDWFQALNQDFRYQLTAIGAPSPNLYIAREVTGNRFKIAGGVRGTKVSWQVTGIRHDAYANDHRIPVEEVKPAAERGTLLYPGALPAQSASGIGAGRR